MEAQARVDNIEELLRSMQEFLENDGKSVAEYLDRVSLFASTDQYDDQEDSLSLMTVHNSKGLEFHSVFIVGMEEGIFPHYRSIEENDPEEIEEERRLCYVAITRAQKNLFMTSAVRRQLYRNTQFNPISRFIQEIPNELLNFISKPTSSFSSASYQSDSSSSYEAKSYKNEFNQGDFDDGLPSWQIGASFNHPYSPGTKIKHPTFGQGTVKKCEGDQDNLKLTIQFRAIGMKKILLNYCNIEIV